MNADTIKLLDQLTTLESTAGGRVTLFKAAQAELARRVSGQSAEASAPESPLLKQLEQDIAVEGAMFGLISTYVGNLNNWLKNDPSRASLGLEPLPMPPIPPSIVEYFASVMAVLSPGAPAIFAPLPTPTPPVTVKPGAPPGANSPFGYI